jgi:hypothetical protein
MRTVLGRPLSPKAPGTECSADPGDATVPAPALDERNCKPRIRRVPAIT